MFAPEDIRDAVKEFAVGDIEVAYNKLRHHVVEIDNRIENFISYFEVNLVKKGAIECPVSEEVNSNVTRIPLPFL